MQEWQEGCERGCRRGTILAVGRGGARECAGGCRWLMPGGVGVPAGGWPVVSSRSNR